MLHKHDLGATASTEWIVIGRFGRPHGVKGWISVYSFTDPAENLMHYDGWHIKVKGQYVPLGVTTIEQRTRYFAVQLETYHDRESVVGLTNAEIMVTADKLPFLKKGEFYCHQLIGMEVLSTTGFDFGKVVDVLATGSNDVLIIEGSERYLIPFRMGAVVQNIDVTKHQIIVDWENQFI